MNLLKKVFESRKIRYELCCAPNILYIHIRTTFFVLTIIEQFFSISHLMSFFFCRHTFLLEVQQQFEYYEGKILTSSPLIPVLIGKLFTIFAWNFIVRRWNFFNTSLAVCCIWDAWGVPSAPTGPLQATASSDSVALRWNPPEKDGGSKLLGYCVEKRDPKRSTWSFVQRTVQTVSIHNRDVMWVYIIIHQNNYTR